MTTHRGMTHADLLALRQATGAPVHLAPSPVIRPGDAILTIGDVVMGNEDIWGRSMDRSVAFFDEVHTGHAYEVTRAAKGTSTVASRAFEGALRRAAMRRSGILPRAKTEQGPALFSATGLPAIADEATGR